MFKLVVLSEQQYKCQETEEKHQILTLEKQENKNVQYLCFINDLDY